jgi:hypothetical protein
VRVGPIVGAGLPRLILASGGVNLIPPASDERASTTSSAFLRFARWPCQREGHLMTSLAILSFVAGAVLGLWFRVSVLALATSLANRLVLGRSVTAVRP